MIAVAEGLKATLHCLENSRIDYMVVGSIATAVYGEPRLTRDLDVVVQVKDQAAKIFLEYFPTSEFYVPPEVVLVQEFSHRGQFNLLHMNSGLKIDVVVQKPTAHGVAEFERRRQVEMLPNVKAWIASPEDLIIAKLRYYREGESEKHLRDIRGILAQTPVDHSYLSGWTQSLHLTEQWQKV